MIQMKQKERSAMNGLDDAASYFNNINCPSVIKQTEYEIQRKIAYIKKFITTDSNRILVIGCGDGSIEYELNEKFHFNEICLVDFSPHLLYSAKKKIPNASVLLCDLREELIHIKGEYDLIYSANVMQYLKESQIQKLNESLIRNLSCRGRLIHFNIPDKRRRFLYRINNSIIFNNIKYLSCKYDFIDIYSRWCNRSEFLMKGNWKTTFVTPSFDWERFDAIIERL